MIYELLERYNRKLDIFRASSGGRDIITLLMKTKLAIEQIQET